MNSNKPPYQMRATALLLLCLFFSQVNAQKFHQGTITLTTGETRSGLVKPPNDKAEKKIEFKELEGAEVVKYNSGAVSTVSVQEEGFTYNFYYKKTNVISSTKLEENMSYKSRGPYWLVELETGHSTLLAEGNYIKIRKDGSMVFRSDMTSGFIFFYIVNEQYPVPTYFCYYSPNTVGQQKWFRRLAAHYMKDEPSIVERINNKEWINLEIVQLFREYNKLKSIDQ